MPKYRALRQRALLTLAILFGVTTVAYTGLWLYSIRWQAQVGFGIDYTFQPGEAVMRVDGVTSGGPADRAGLRKGDRINAINSHPLNTLEPYWAVRRSGKPGETVKLTVSRSPLAVPFTVRLSLQARPQPGPEEITPRTLIVEVTRLYPLPFLVVGLVVLFLRLDDRHAWLLGILFGGFIASAPVFPQALPPPLQRFAHSYHSLALLTPSLFYYFFAVFPVSSPIDRRIPWLKNLLLSVFLPISVSFALGIAISGAVWSWTAALFSFRAMRLFLTSMWVGCLLLGMGSLASNARSSPSREAGRKIRVLVWGTVAGLIPAVVLDAASLYTGKVLLEYPFWMVTITVMAMFLFPISFAYAVVKHRVLEIPILLKRSARYLLVQRGFVLLTVLWGTAFTGLFISVALKLAHLLPRNPELALWTIAAAAVSFGLVLALAGARLHERVTRRIDRAFFRIAYDARVILQGLSDQVRTASDRGELAGRLGQEILSALHPQSLAVYFERGPGKLEIQRGNAPGQLATLSTDLPELVELARLAKPWDVPLDAAGNPKFPVLELLRPECLVPLLVREGRLIGLLVLGPRLSEEPYSGEDKALLASVAGQAAIALENIRLAEQIAVRMEAEQRAAHDMEIARQVQARLFPQKLPALRTLDYAGGCIQAREVGGDYYDFLELGPRRVALVLADIAGKGISGALLMANLQANLRSQYAVALDDPARLLASVNHLFYENTADASYATLFFADYSDATRELRYVNCGHNPPFLIRADGRVERLRATATVLGLFEDWECSVATALLNPRDLLVIYTDGITEASSQTGEEFGEDRLGGLLLAHRNDSARGLLDTIVNAVKQFSGSEQSDDLTLVIACAQELV